VEQGVKFSALAIVVKMVIEPLGFDAIEID
jgi:hypothetical protein